MRNESQKEHACGRREGAGAGEVGAMTIAEAEAEVRRTEYELAEATRTRQAAQQREIDAAERVTLAKWNRQQVIAAFEAEAGAAWDRVTQ